MTDLTEIQIARDMFAEAIFQVEAEGRSVHTFASAALLAASELYSETHGPDTLHRAFAALLRAEAVASGAAGRA